MLCAPDVSPRWCLIPSVNINTRAELPARPSIKQAAEYIGEGATKFDEMVDDGRKPKPHRIDRRVCRGIGYDWIKLTLIERPSE